MNSLFCFSVILALLLLAFSCRTPDKDETYIVFTAHRVIKNESLNNVTLRIYDDGQLIEEYQIAPSDSIQNSETCLQKRNQFECSLNWSFETDSAILVFEQNILSYSKYQKFCSGQGTTTDCFVGFNGKTIMDLLDVGYIRRTVKKDKYFTYSITESDYMAAVPLN